MSLRVVITGIGVISPVGSGKSAFWDGLSSGKSGIRQITKFDSDGFASKIAGELVDFDPADFFSSKEARRLDPFCQYALAAAQMAFEDAKLPKDDIDPYSSGAMVGSGTGGLTTMEDAVRILVKDGPRRISPFTVPMMISNMAAGQISIYYGLKGPNTCVVTACATGSHSIGEAFRIVKRGEADMMIAGGAEAPITPLGVSSFCAMKALSTRNQEPQKASRPFDNERDGFVIAEGCGLVILESLSHARERGASIYAEVIGYGLSADAYHISAPDISGEGAAAAMTGALKEAGISPRDVDYINAHGTSTKYNDKIETLAIKKVFDKQAYELKVSSTKSMTGHQLGAAGGVEAVAAVLILENNCIPPTINYENPDPECDLDYVPNKAVFQQVDMVMTNSFGFGGQNAVLLIKRFE